MALLLNFLTTAVVIVVVLGIIVLVHELGHFLAARKFGCRVEEFGMGMPPRLCGWKKVKGKFRFFWKNNDPNPKDSDTTIYSLNYLPIGGFCKITGEDAGETNSMNVGNAMKKEKKDTSLSVSAVKDPKNFAYKLPWQRAVILLAGVIMNIVFGTLLLMLIFWSGSAPLIKPEKAHYDHKITRTKVTLMALAEDGPAAKSGLKKGDVFLEVNGRKINKDNDLVRYVNSHPNEEIELIVKRGSKSLVKMVKPEPAEQAYRYTGPEVSATSEDKTIKNLGKDDLIIAIKEGSEFKLFDSKKDLAERMNKLVEAKKEEVLIRIQRGNEIFDIKTNPANLGEENLYSDVGIIGIDAYNIDHYRYPWWKVPMYGIIEMYRFLVYLPQELYRQLHLYFTGAVKEAPVTGPVGIAVITNYAMSFGWVMVVSLMINITVALAVFNVLPLPALDGGRVIFIIIEKLRGRPINPKIEQKVNAIGFLCLIGLAVLITVSDVSRFKDILMFWRK